ncbi:MAG: GTPase ObgE [Kiritimatiellia bacterium]
MKSRRFVDAVIAHVKAGDGGNGCVSFRREKSVPRGGPDGGDGGRGGDVILRGDRNRDSLVHLFYRPHQQAGSGMHGRGKKQHGRDGRTLVIPVPLGTEVWDESGTQKLGEITAEGQELLVARGGKGGYGNCHWLSPTHQAPREHTQGEPGERKTLRLVLKLLADIGLAGLPNAGKSSILAALTDAHPKIAAYPFTTLHPLIGTLVFDDHTSIRIADIPGLIQGAHEGRGLGHTFLRHIERAALLLFIIDMAEDDPVGDYFTLQKELELHRDDLVRRPSLIVANKMDLPGTEEKYRLFCRETHQHPIPVSALTRNGISQLRDAIHSLWTSIQETNLKTETTTDAES